MRPRGARCHAPQSVGYWVVRAPLGAPLPASDSEDAGAEEIELGAAVVLALE